MTEKIAKLMLFQIAFAVIIVVLITAIRFFLPQTFNEFREQYKPHFQFDTDISLVDGEEQ